MGSRLYDRRRWHRLRRQKLAADPLCEYCPSGQLTPATAVDHRLRIRDGGAPWAWDNLVSTCQACHSRKTMHVDVLGKDRVPAKGCDASGMPADPEHPWSAKKIARS